MMRAESRTEKSTLLLPKSAPGNVAPDRAALGETHPPPVPTAWLPLCRGSHQNMQARQEMQIVGMLLPSTRCLSWKGQVPHLLCRVQACVCHLRDQAPHLRTSGVVLCDVCACAGNGGDWGEQPGPMCGKNKTAYPPALPASFSDCDRG